MNKYFYAKQNNNKLYKIKGIYQLQQLQKYQNIIF